MKVVSRFLVIILYIIAQRRARIYDESSVWCVSGKSIRHDVIINCQSDELQGHSHNQCRGRRRQSLCRAIISRLRIYNIYRFRSELPKRPRLSHSRIRHDVLMLVDCPSTTLFYIRRLNVYQNCSLRSKGHASHGIEREYFLEGKEKIAIFFTSRLSEAHGYQP